MKTFRQFLTNNKKLHLEHLEDAVFSGGIPGIQQSVDFLTKIRNTLMGESSEALQLTVKWGGSAIICGTNPANNKFFVGTKSVFNKTNPKINYTKEDIENNHFGSDDLINKLKLALEEFPKLNIKGVIQGDLLFTAEGVSLKMLGKNNFLTFCPNTITYAINENTELAQKIQQSKLGIVFHTKYIGESLEEMIPNYDFNISELNTNSSVWVNDANFKDVSGTATLTKEENKKIDRILNEISELRKNVIPKVFNIIKGDYNLHGLIKNYVNSRIKLGEGIGATREYVDGLINFISEKYQKEIDQSKTKKGRTNKILHLESVKNIITNNRDQVLLMFTLSNKIQEGKTLFLKKLQQIKTLDTFLETQEGFKVTTSEGFVAIDKISGDVVKLVDRLEFSKANFTKDKHWK